MLLVITWLLELNISKFMIYSFSYFYYFLNKYWLESNIYHKFDMTHEKG